MPRRLPGRAPDLAGVGAATPPDRAPKAADPTSTPSAALFPPPRPQGLCVAFLALMATLLMAAGGAERARHVVREGLRILAARLPRTS